ncbi:hypothetical protein BV22DRAFT_1023530 [Leucogyrophana mollusca]|uniref:Uncharacterized protein n=1 Tax=Leucogyrophana mollusca TaxID=85980 RepID=A0ACB8B0R6_9AGAM|nr:hypothetical protein BV22DRAFT_1023530 [Leucogyrophana mollusca]
MSWAPNETPEEIFVEKGWLNGTVVNAALYGVDATLYFACFRAILRGTTRSNYKKQLPLLLFVAIAFILSTLFTASMTEFTNLAFIDDREYPGGPGAYSRNMFHIPQNEIANVSFVLLTLCADILVLWRCMIIYRGCMSRTSIVMCLPCLMLAASFVLGILFLMQWSKSSPWGKFLGVDFTLPFIGTSLALNILSTIAIVLRLLYYRYRVTSAFGSRHGSHYTSIAGVVVESAAIYSIFSVLFLVTFAINNPVSSIFMDALNPIQMFAALLIILRVTHGHAWSQEKIIEGTTSDSIPMSSFSMRRGRRQANIDLASTPPGITVTKEVIQKYEARSDTEGDADSTSDLRKRETPTLV